MKQFIICLLFAGLGLGVQAQSLESIHKMIDKGKHQEAKDAIDKAMQGGKYDKDPEYWYYKGRIYNNLSYDTSLALDTRSKLKMDAFAAFQTNQQLDPKELRLKIENHQSFLDLYYGMSGLGAEYFKKKQFDQSAESFKKALDLYQFIFGKGYKYKDVVISSIDTATVLNVGIAATQAKNESLAAEYFQKLVDANIGAKEYEVAYEALADYYYKNKQTDALNNIIEKAGKFYPSNAYIADMKLRQISESGDMSKLFDNYEQMIKNDPNNFAIMYNYAIEMYNHLYVGDNKPKDPEPVRTRLTDVLKTAIPLDKEINATSLMANHLFNSSIDFYIAHDNIDGRKPEDIQKRKDLMAKAASYQNDCLPYAEKVLAYYDAMPELKASQKAARVNILTTLSEIYNTKGNKAKAEEYEKLKLKNL
ncbi:MAG: hypothetical protein KF880_08735 [Ferruginibacter sp.]|nr:hypothetical protein [Ferruginibacter sp.]